MGIGRARAELFGGDGRDTLILDGFSEGVKLSMGITRLQFHMDGGAFSVNSVEEVQLTAHDDVVKGSSADESLYGLDGADKLKGKDGADWLDGGAQSDVVLGGGGDDTIVGGEGQDLLSGGGGADTYLFSALADSSSLAPDTIRDLTNADVIDLSGIDADSISFGDQAFHLVDHLTGEAGEAALVVDTVHKVTQLQLDVNGDGAADMLIVIQGDHADFNHFVL